MLCVCRNWGGGSEVGGGGGGETTTNRRGRRRGRGQFGGEELEEEEVGVSLCLSLSEGGENSFIKTAGRRKKVLSFFRTLRGTTWENIVSKLFLRKNVCLCLKFR